jgi:hypothetical protein
MLTEPLQRLFASKAPTASLPLPPLRLLPGETNQFPGGSTSCWKAPAFTAHNQRFLKAVVFMKAKKIRLLERWFPFELFERALKSALAG